jgi:hypothetical protein
MRRLQCGLHLFDYQTLWITVSKCTWEHIHCKLHRNRKNFIAMYVQWIVDICNSKTGTSLVKMLGSAGQPSLTTSDINPPLPNSATSTLKNGDSMFHRNNYLRMNATSQPPPPPPKKKTSSSIFTVVTWNRRKYIEKSLYRLCVLRANHLVSVDSSSPSILYTSGSSRQTQKTIAL